ncbi:hypothetical protein A3F65_03455 [Candidatus Saccharibacteria bacterium RIFCSPHIGHO2_12_FULL_47_16b]|nr:MAG: hypothetical protein A3F65_03455 [Candidatus Saccharibacteria bacterium RIFCSPHIGHO2_12_FULL_47_16b]
MEPIHGAGSIVKQSTKTLVKDPHIILYPYLAVIFILLTSPLVSALVLSLWRNVGQPQIIGQVVQAAPSTFLPRLGLVTFSVFYTLFITSLFICAVSASTLARLEGRSVPLFYGVSFVVRHFFRVAKFAVLAIFFFPLGLIAQRHRFKTIHGGLEAIASSFSLSMAQIAPAIIEGHSGVISTVKHSLDTLGHFWKESIVIRLGTLAGILFLGSLSFLPKLVENYWFDGPTAQAVGWIVTILLGVSSYVVLRVISTVFTTTLYHRAKQQNK